MEDSLINSFGISREVLEAYTLLYNQYPYPYLVCVVMRRPYVSVSLNLLPCSRTLTLQDSIICLLSYILLSYIIPLLVFISQGKPKLIYRPRSSISTYVMLCKGCPGKGIHPLYYISQVFDANPGYNFHFYRQSMHI